MDADVGGAVPAQNLQGPLLALAVATGHPQQETALVELALQRVGVLLADETAEQGTDDATAAAIARPAAPPLKTTAPAAAVAPT